MSSTQVPSTPAHATPASTQPTVEPQASSSDLTELRQLTLESGRVIDLPSSILKDPAPTPVQFLHLQHHFSGTHGTPVDLSQCESADEAIDVLANEIEAIRLLLYGYVVNFKRYVDRFDAAHDLLRSEVRSVAESCEGVCRLAVPAHEAAIEAENRLIALEEKISKLPLKVAHKPPKLKRSRRGQLANPELSEEENRELLARQRRSHGEETAVKGLRKTGKRIEDAAILKDVLDPPPPAPAAPKPRKRLDFTHEVKLKIEKVAQGVEAAREQLHAADVVTGNELAVLRYYEDACAKDADELWAWYRETERKAFTAGKISQYVERRAQVYDDWATSCGKGGPEPGASTGAEETDVSGETSHEAPPPSPSHSGDPATPSPSSLPAPAPGPLNAPPLDGDLYAVTLDLSCDKPYDELTREEAIDVLKSLPLRVHFVPHVAPDAETNDKGASVEASEPTDVGAKTVDPPPESPCPTPGEKAVAAVVPPSTASPVSSDRDQCAVKPRSRKRTRTSDAAELSCGDAQKDSVDPRPQSGGSPIKKKHGSDSNA
ncbi:hypothetical protein C8Q78DRAFT_995456 [Trametes maxima]|nr:hypothetical protein C8Q78DRAFT_995456 [Trametes maxima]